MPMAEKYVYLEHSTDALIEAYGPSIEEAFVNAAKATVDTIVELDRVKPKERIQFIVTGHDMYELLYNWLENILSVVDTDQLLLKEFNIRIIEKPGGFSLEADCFGQKFDEKVHNFRTAVKAPTYHEMSIRKAGPQYILKFLLDL
jgi:SHS2 domain-containing protein